MSNAITGKYNGFPFSNKFCLFAFFFLTYCVKLVDSGFDEVGTNQCHQYMSFINLTHSCGMDFPIIFDWVCSVPILGAIGIHFISIVDSYI